MTWTQTINGRKLINFPPTKTNCHHLQRASFGAMFVFLAAAVAERSNFISDDDDGKQLLRNCIRVDFERVIKRLKIKFIFMKSSSLPPP